MILSLAVPDGGDSVGLAEFFQTQEKKSLFTKLRPAVISNTFAAVSRALDQIPTGTLAR